MGVVMLSDPDGKLAHASAADCTRKTLLTGADLTVLGLTGGDLALGM